MTSPIEVAPQAINPGWIGPPLNEKGVWREWPDEERDKQFALSADLFERFYKAGGHINATERKLWNETERALWSARQAQARVSETFLLLTGRAEAFPPIERYLHKDVLEERLQALESMQKTADVETVWMELKEAENVICTVSFPQDVYAISKDTLREGLDRKWRYIRALRSLLEAAEMLFVDRFIVLKPGDWIWLYNGPAKVIKFRGAAIESLRPEFYPPFLKYEPKTHLVSIKYVTRYVEPPVHVRFTQDVSGKIKMFLTMGKDSVYMTSHGSDRDDSFRNLLNWLQRISDGDLPQTIEVDEFKEDDENEFQYEKIELTAYKEDGRLLLRAGSRCEYSASHAVDALVYTSVFLEAFRSAFKIFFMEKFDCKLWTQRVGEVEADSLGYAGAILKHPFMVGA